MSVGEQSRQKLLALYEARSGASEVIQVDYRRREDLALGVKSHMEHVWPRIAIWKMQIHDDGLTKRQKIELFVILLGAIISWATSPDGLWSWHWGFGGWLALAAWLSYMSGVVEQQLIRRDVERLKDVEKEALGRWIGAGAHADDFWSIRDNVVRLAETESSGDFEHGREAERKLEGLWVTVQETLYCRACGDLFALDAVTTGSASQA